jgi:hypothetical protein
VVDHKTHNGIVYPVEDPHHQEHGGHGRRVESCHIGIKDQQETAKQGLNRNISNIHEPKSYLFPQLDPFSVGSYWLWKIFYIHLYMPPKNDDMRCFPLPSTFRSTQSSRFVSGDPHEPPIATSPAPIKLWALFPAKNFSRPPFHAPNTFSLLMANLLKNVFYKKGLIPSNVV